MLGEGTPDGWAAALPGHGGARVFVDAWFSPAFHARRALALGGAWAV
jgi:hypothetical protein